MHSKNYWTYKQKILRANSICAKGQFGKGFFENDPSLAHRKERYHRVLKTVVSTHKNIFSWREKPWKEIWVSCLKKIVF